MNTKEAVAQRILDLCAERNIAINALALTSGISPSTIYSMLNEKSQNPGIPELLEIMREHSAAELPEYVRELSLDDYFSERVTGSYAIKTIKNAWKTSRTSFEISTRNNELRYNAGATWEPLHTMLKGLNRFYAAFYCKIKSNDSIVFLFGIKMKI